MLFFSAAGVVLQCTLYEFRENDMRYASQEAKPFVMTVSKNSLLVLTTFTAWPQHLLLSTVFEPPSYFERCAPNNE